MRVPALDLGRWPSLVEIGRDLRYALRALRRAPGFTAAAVSSLGLGLALTACTVAVFNAYLVRAMPYPAADRLYHVVYAPPGEPEPRGLSALDWGTLRDVIEIADMSQGARYYLTDGDHVQEALGMIAAPGSLEALGVRAVAGRSFVEDDFHAGAEPVALIGQGLWRERFGSDPAVIGRVLRANRANQAEPTETFRIVGILPPGFRNVQVYARGVVDVVTPLRTTMRAYMVRLHPGVPPLAAEQRITDAARAVGTSFPPGWRGVRLESVQDRYVEGLRPILVAVTVAAGIVLVIVCANISVLVLLRAMRRRKEVAVRLALGAGRGRIGLMLAAESALVCAAGVTLGIVVGALTLRLLAPVIEERLGRPVPGGTAAIAVDSTILLAVGALSVVIALALAGIPLLSSRPDRLAQALRSGGRGETDGPSARRFRSALVATEVGASLALLVGCGLMLRSVLHLARTDLGFRTAGVERARIALPERKYGDAPAMMAFYDRLTERVAVRFGHAFALSNFPLLVEPPKQAVEIEAGPSDGRPAGVLTVGAGFFDLLDIRVVRGRRFAVTDRPGSEPVAVISESLARRLWPDGSAIGRRLRTGEEPVSRSPLSAWRTVVGIVRDVRQSYTDEDLADIYLPFSQAPARYAPLLLPSDAARPFPLAALRAIAAEIDREVLVGEASPLEVDADRQLAHPRFLASMLGGFAIFATLLGLVGIHGVTAYAVQQREREVAIRIAIGATGPAIVRMFVKDGGLVMALGLALGVLGAAAVARVLASQVHGVRPFDVGTIVGACVVIAVAGLVAMLRPARRAAATDPVTALNAS